MQAVKFQELATHLKTGREIEFVYHGKRFSITNSKGYWNLCSDSDNSILERLCKFEEKELLVSKIEHFQIGGVTIAEIFDALSYDASSLWVL